MLKQTLCNSFKGILISLSLLMLMTIAPWAMAQSFLESPTSGSFESGIGLIRGWVCNASAVDVIIDSGTEDEIQLAAAYPTRRADTSDPCGDSDNGFGVTINWNNIGDGVHSLRALADGIEFANVNFVVTTLGDPPFRTDLSGEFSLNDFPFTGNTTLTRWSEAHQNFVIASNLNIPANPSPPNVAGTFLESPTQGSFESGVGLIRGWVCDADAIEIVITSDTNDALEIRRAAAYPTRRQDTVNACGDSDNGFGVTINWNNLENGVYTLSALADGVEFANVNFAVTQLGQGFVTGLSGDFPLVDFPVSPQQTTLRWSEPHQNFVISTSTATGDKTALIAAIRDQLNPLGIIAADPSNFGSLFGVRSSRTNDGQTTALQSLDWADLNAGLWVRLLLGAGGLPDLYQDSQGIEVRFDNYTDNSVDIRIFDSSGGQIAGPIPLNLDLSRLLPLQDLISGLGGISISTARSFNIPQKHILSTAEAATLEKFTVELAWAAGIALNETLCQIAVPAFVNEVASAGCDAAVVSGFRSLANAPGGALDPLVQRALQFSRQDLDNVPCNAEESSNNCFQEAVAALREIEPEQGGGEGGEPPSEIPSVPASVQASDGLFPDRVSITWDTVTDATFYEIYRDGSQIGEENGPPFNDFNVSAGTVYGYQVTACNDLGCSERSASDDGFAEQQGEQEEQFTVTANAGDGGIILPSEQTVNAGSTASFTVIPDAGYLISEVSGCGGSLSGDTYTTGPIAANCTISANFSQQQPETYVLTLTTTGTGSGAVSGGGQYSAGDAVDLLADPNSTSTFDGWSPSPCAASFTMPAQDLTCTATFTLIDPPPGVPNNVQATDGSSTDWVTTTWDSVTLATSYEVYRDGELIGQPSGPRFRDNSVTPGQRYDYTVSACNVMGCSAASPSEAGHARLSAPLEASTFCQGIAANFGWSQVTGAINEYEVYRGSASSTGSLWGTTGANTTSIGIFSVTSSWYRVRACNNDTGCGDFSAPAQGPSCGGFTS